MMEQRINAVRPVNWLNRVKCWVAAAVLVATGSSMAFRTANASSVRVTQEEAQSILDAFGNGGWAILLHNPVQAGGPADSEVRAAVRPVAFYAGRHYCIDDWHVLLIAYIAGGSSSFTYGDAAAELDPISVHLTLDSVSLMTTRTSIKRFLNPERFGLEEAYYFQEGTLKAPSELSVGRHELALTASNGDHSKARFYIDASGTGACL